MILNYKSCKNGRKEQIFRSGVDGIQDDHT
jgi:hypothetical protein